MRKLHPYVTGLVGLFLLLYVQQTSAQNLINENFDAAAAAPSGWTSVGTPVWNVQACSGSNALAFNGSGDGAYTPLLTRPGTLTFNKKRSSNTTAWELTIAYATNPSGTWTTLTTVTSVSASCGANPSIDLSSLSNVYIRFLDTRSSGAHERGIDDVVITTREPSAASTSLAFSSVTTTGMTIGWTSSSANNGMRRAVFVKQGSGTITAPTDGVKYTASANWNSKGTQLGTSGYYCVYDGTGTSVSLTNLTAATSYYVYVYEYNSDNTPTASTINYYNTALTGNQTTASNAPNNPNTFTATTASASQINLAATANAASDNIVVVYNATGTFTTPTNGSAPTAAGTTLAGSGGTIVYAGAASGLASHTALTANSRYYYKTFSYNASNIYSTGITANAYTLPNRPASASPTAITEAGFTANWQAPATQGSVAFTYAIERDINNAFSAADITSSIASSVTSQQYTGVAPQTQYFYRVKAVNAGGSSDYSDTASLYTLSNPPVSEAANFSATTGGTSSIVLTWDAANFPATGATEKGYIILRRQSSNPTINNIANGVAPAALSLPMGTSLLTNITNAATVTYTDAALSSGVTYGYIIIPYTWDGVNTATYHYYTNNAVADDATTDTNIDNPGSFSVAPASSAVIDVTVTGNTAGSNMVIVYNTSGAFSVPVAGIAAGSTGASFAGGTIVYNGAVATGIQHTALTPATHYYYKAFAYDASNNYSSGVEADTYTLTDAPVATAATAITTSGFTANWQAVTGASGYLLDVATDNTFTSFVAGLQNLTVTGTSYSVTGLNAAATYYYRVRANNANAAESDYSNSINVVTYADEPVVQATGLVFNNVTTNSLTASWTAASTTPTGYIVIRRMAAIPDAPVDGTTYQAGDVLGNSTVVFVGNATSFNETLLTAGTEYRYRVYAYNGSGAAVNYLQSGPLAGTAYTLSLEPVAHPVSFTAAVNSATNVTLNFSAANTITNAAGYLILKKTTVPVSGLPVDGNNYIVGEEIGIDTVAARITDINATSQAVTVVAGATTYFTIIPFNSDGTNSGTYNYYTDPIIATTFATTPSAASDIRALVGSEATTVSSIANTATITTSTDGIQVWQFTIRDGALAGDDDQLPTIVSALTFSQSSGNAINNFSNAIQSIALFNGSTLISNTATVTTTQVQFTGLNITVPDNDSITITVRLSVKSNVNGGATTSSTANNIDGDDFGFTLTSANVVTAGVSTSSQMSSFTAQSSANGQNVYTVVATALAFVQQPSNVQTGTNMSPAVTVRGVDAGGNLDLTTTTVTLTANSATLSSGGSASTASGVATFSSLQFSTSGTGVTLTASINSGTVAVTSNSFTVTAAPVVVYKHTFGTTSPTAQPYTTAPDVFASNLSSSSWTGSGTFTGSAGNGGSGSGALSMTPGTATRTFTLTFNVASGYALAITGFDFWRVSSSSGPDTWTLTINGTQVGSGSIPTTGALLGATNVSAERSGLTGAITVVYTVSGGSGTSGTTRLDDFTLYGNVTSLCAAGSWTGATNTNPTTSSNWCNSTLPGSSTDVSIGSGLSNYPSVATGQTLNVRNLTLASGASLTVTGTLNITGNISNNGTLTASAGTVSFNGTAAQSIPANAFAGNTVKNLTINNTAGVTLQGTLNVTGLLTPTAGTFNTGGYLTLKSTSIANTALVNVVGSNAAITGNVTVERFIPQSIRALRDIAPGVNTTQTFFNSWQEAGNNSTLFGTHITGKKGAVGTIDPTTGLDLTASGNPSLYSYDINSAGAATWNTKTSTNQSTDVVQVLKAYRISLRGNRSHNLATDVAAMSTPVILRNTGTLVTGNMVINTTGVSGAINTTEVKLNSASATGFTLIGNPYVAPLDWESVQAASSDIDPAYWTWDANIGSTGSYVTYSTSTGLTSNGGSNVNKYIQPGQGFFVRNAGSNPELVINEAHKAINSTLTGVFKSSGTGYENIRLNLLKVNGNDTLNMDGAVVAFDNGFSKAAAKEDAGKISNPNENMALITDAKTLSVEARPLPESDDTLTIKVWNTTNNATYRLRINLTNFTQANVQPYLKDAFANTSTLLTKGNINTYAFTTTSNTASYNERFKIVFVNTTLPVRFINVKATPVNKDVKLIWTANETDANAYIIEHSLNTTEWSVINNVKAVGSGTQTYNYVHANHVSSVHYYRILSVDKSGNKQYSSIVAVNMSGKAVATVSPNPVQNGVLQLFLNNMPAGNYQLSLFNAAGQLVRTTTVTHQSSGTTYTMSLQQQPSGTYSLQLMSGKTIQHIQVLVP